MTATTHARPHAGRTLLLGASALLVGLAGLGMGQAQAQAQPQPPAQAAAQPPSPQQAGPHRAMHHHMAPGRGPGMDMQAPMLPPRLLDAVGASAEQKAKLQDIFKAARDDLRAQHDSRQALHTQMMALLAAPQVDAAAAEGLRQKQLALHDTASKRMLQAMLDAQAVLTPEQRAKLAERMAEHHRRMEQPGQHPRHERRAPEAPKG